MRPSPVTDRFSYAFYARPTRQAAAPHTRVTRRKRGGGGEAPPPTTKKPATINYGGHRMKDRAPTCRRCSLLNTLVQAASITRWRICFLRTNSLVRASEEGVGSSCGDGEWTGVQLPTRGRHFHFAQGSAQAARPGCVRACVHVDIRV